MPQEIRAVAPGELEVAEYEPPDLTEGQVRVRTEFAAAKHGTEMAFFKGYARERGRYDADLGVFVRQDQGPEFGPYPVGDMFVGTITECGPGVQGFSAGDRVVGYGKFREVQTAETGLCWKVPDGLSWKSAVCVDPADFALGAVRDGHVRLGDAVAVFGMGAIGLTVVQILKLAGAAPVIAVEPLEKRREVARACGADVVLDPANGDAGLEVRRLTGKRGVDVAIEFSGNVHAMHQALRAVAFGGTVVAGAFPAPYGPGLDLGAEAHINRPQIVFSRACSEPNRDHPRWDERRMYATCWRLICEGKIVGDDIVDPVVPFEEAPQAYARIATAPEESVKLGVEF